MAETIDRGTRMILMRIPGLRLERCPYCGSLGSIDDDQRAGRVSIECLECGHHYFKEAKTVV